MQMSFRLPTIDKDATRDAVDRELEKYRMYLLMDPEENEPKITSQFKLVASAPSNVFHSTTEDTAIKKIDQENKRQEFINKIQRAVNRLALQERSIIIKRYLTDDEVYDYEVYNDLGFSERKYYRIKSRAFYKLALILRIEVYIKNCPDCGGELFKFKDDYSYWCRHCEKDVDQELVKEGEAS